MPLNTPSDETSDENGTPETEQSPDSPFDEALLHETFSLDLNAITKEWKERRIPAIVTAYPQRVVDAQRGAWERQGYTLEDTFQFGQGHADSEQRYNARIKELWEAKEGGTATVEYKTVHTGSDWGTGYRVFLYTKPIAKK